MLSLPNCNVITEDEIHPVLDRAMVTVVGESPNCTVRVSEPDMVAKKFRQVDQFTAAAFTRQGDTWTFTGRSQYMADEIGTEDAVITIQVTPEPGCEECNK